MNVDLRRIAWPNLGARPARQANREARVADSRRAVRAGSAWACVVEAAPARLAA